MNTLKITIIALFVGVFASAQMGVPQTVYDPTASANMGKQIQASTQQLSQLEQTVEYMKKAEEKLNQVNGYVRDMEDLKKIVEMQKVSLQNATKIQQKIGKIKNATIRKKILSDTTTSIREISNSIVFINKILSSGFFSMSDNERMTWIKTQRDKVFSNYLKIKNYAR